MEPLNLSPFDKMNRKSSIRATTHFCNQILSIENNVLQHLNKNKQISKVSREAGGQLFGIVNTNKIRITSITGPYDTDDRGRHHYRSNPKAAQDSIDEKAKQGLNYLGEWHTHAEDIPIVSRLDLDTMKQIVLNSDLNINYVILVIVGRTSIPNCLNITSHNNTQPIVWTIS